MVIKRYIWTYSKNKNHILLLLSNCWTLKVYVFIWLSNIAKKTRNCGNYDKGDITFVHILKSIGFSMAYIDTFKMHPKENVEIWFFWG